MDKIKLIAYYLPQFHEIPENNEFWGKGFTEWVNVTKAEPLFKGHYQPRIPFQNNYYDLSKESVMVKQMELAKEYGLYGFCFYHYWFHGKKMLHRPLDNLLKTPEGCLNYCISWANEPWVRTWHAGGGKYEVLIEQEYGEREEWEAHLDYLLPFFKDDRYIKVDNKPMLIIYNIAQIGCRRRMFSLWEKKAKDNGFSGLYILGMRSNIWTPVKFNYVSGSVDFCPSIPFYQEKRTNSRIGRWKIEQGYKYCKIPVLRKFLHTKYSYDQLNALSLSLPRGRNEIRCAFTGYDDTPRRQEWARVIYNSTPEKFQFYLKQNLLKSQQENKQFLFINAWNEWGEGAYLEPDEKYGYQYLEAVKIALNSIGDNKS